MSSNKEKREMCETRNNRKCHRSSRLELGPSITLLTELSLNKKNYVIANAIP